MKNFVQLKFTAVLLYNVGSCFASANHTGQENFLSDKIHK